MDHSTTKIAGNSQTIGTGFTKINATKYAVGGGLTKIAGNTRQIGLKILPPAYQQVEYISANGGYCLVPTIHKCYYGLDMESYGYRDGTVC